MNIKRILFGGLIGWLGSFSISLTIIYVFHIIDPIVALLFSMALGIIGGVGGSIWALSK